jgi:hypothetical protein
MGVTSYYSFGGEILGEETGGVRRDYLTDALGSVTATVTGAGVVENTYRYKPYGDQLAKTGTGSDPKFLWGGELGCRENKLKYADKYDLGGFYSTQLGTFASSIMLGQVLPPPPPAHIAPAPVFPNPGVGRPIPGIRPPMGGVGPITPRPPIGGINPAVPRPQPIPRPVPMVAPSPWVCLAQVLGACGLLLALPAPAGGDGDMIRRTCKDDYPFSLNPCDDDFERVKRSWPYGSSEDAYKAFRDRFNFEDGDGWECRKQADKFNENSELPCPGSGSHFSVYCKRKNKNGKFERKASVFCCGMCQDNGTSQPDVWQSCRYKGGL